MLFWLFIKLQLEKKSGPSKTQPYVLQVSRCFSDFAGFPRFSGPVSIQEFGSFSTISENRKTTALKKDGIWVMLAPRPGPFSIGLVAQPFFDFSVPPPKNGLGKFVLLLLNVDPEVWIPKNCCWPRYMPGTPGQQNTPNLGVDVDDVDDLTKKSLKIQ